MLSRLSRYYMTLVDPGWLVDAERQHSEQLRRGLNDDAMFRLDADPTRLGEISNLWRSDPSEAFTQFLPLAEAGSVWSMVQIAHAYEAGRGVRVDLVRAEQWYTRAYQAGSDFGLLAGSVLAVTRGDVAKARSMLDDGVARGLARAMTYLAWLELKTSRGRQSRLRARHLYEQAMASGDFEARTMFGRAMAYGRFGLRAIPTGMRMLLDAAHDFTTQVDAKRA